MRPAYRTLLGFLASLAAAALLGQAPLGPLQLWVVEAFGSEDIYPSEGEVQRITRRSFDIGLNDRLFVRVKGLPEAQAAGHDLTRLTLFLDGNPMAGLTPKTIDPQQGLLGFVLTRDPQSRDAWTPLLGRPGRLVRTGTLVSVGYPDVGPVPPDPEAVRQKRTRAVNLVVVRRGWFYFWLVGITLAAVLFVYLARRSNIIRDSLPPQLPAGQRKPYSLARLQIAVWFFLVVAAFLLIWCITGDYDTITEQALILIGIGTGTALGAAAVDANKRNTAEEKLETLQPQQAALGAAIRELQARLRAHDQNAPALAPTDLTAARIDLAEKEAENITLQAKIAEAQTGCTRPVSTGFWNDILTDANGISFHRFQLVVWTIVLGFLFCEAVYRGLAMPKFTTTQLALLGISAGTFLGFKIPERQT